MTSANLNPMSGIIIIIINISSSSRPISIGIRTVS